MTWDVIAPGTWLVFGIIGFPVYSLVLGWILGKPRSGKMVALGVTLLIGITTALWTGMYVTQLAIKTFFFGGLF